MAQRLKVGAGAGARALLVLSLLAIHLIVGEQLATGWGAWNDRRNEAPRLQVVYLHEMSLSVPPSPAFVVRPSAPRLIEPAAVSPVSLLESTEPIAMAMAAPAASMPMADAASPDQTLALAEPISSVEPHDSVDPTGEDSDPRTSAGQGATENPRALPAFVWPTSTRLSYVLTGNYRGEVHGSAQVEWINAQPRYQVNLDVTVGLPFAPIYQREMRSDGRLDHAGLNPMHFQQRSKLAFQPMHRIGVQIGADSATADDGRRLPTWAPAGVAAREVDHQTQLQDSASQFVQMTYLFTTQPQLLTPGSRIGFPLLLPSGIRDWVYEVGQQQTIHTRFGAIEAFHVKSATGLSRGRDQLLAEAWFAPRLSYLPVRLRIEQHADLFIDMILARSPEMAAP